MSAYDPLDVDHYHYISADNPTGPDTSGIARRWGYWGEEHSGSICWPAKKERTAITEFWGNPKDWEGGKLNADLIRKGQRKWFWQYITLSGGLQSSNGGIS